MNYLKLTIVSLISFTALSSPCMGELYGEFGVAVDHPHQRSYSDTKHVELGYTDYNSFFTWQAGVGGWTDITGYGTLNSQYVTAQGGVRVEGQQIHMAYLIGPMLQTHPDILLGSYFELEHSVMIMFVDREHRAIGVILHHWSDGGLASNNYGRNALCIRLEF